MRANRSHYLLYGQQKPGMVRGIPIETLEARTEVIIPMVDLSRPTAMDFHAKNNHLYLADSQRLKIERQNLDLGTKEDFLSKGNFQLIVFVFFFYLKSILEDVNVKLNVITINVISSLMYTYFKCPIY